MDNKQPGTQTQPEKRDWANIVTNSNGTRIFLPDEMKERANEVEALRKAFNISVGELSEKEITLNMATQNFFFDLRKYLAGKGVDIWTKELGFESAALKEGIYVINLKDTEK